MDSDSRSDDSRSDDSRSDDPRSDDPRSAAHAPADGDHPVTTEPPIVPDGDGNTADERLTQHDQGAVNLQPGPTEQGGHGGMATREQEAREAGSAG
ncbi:hypothetical protein JL107_07615 [Nakamurella flavida]|uniref:Uncharacterized protein n=1 Tax=Nakamurella flavida TaxID=363630 RepID=A0A938YJJ5_9ACTN|nr:hypothetical protein [Nakamurella flavida]MBM9476304.1 hypothetical protein [Nakamurella flavida]MDP9779596.1 hypothetical protein [Nakamurella flavida]